MPFPRAPRLVSAAAAIGLALVAWTCATTPNPNAAKYPPRGRRCAIHVYNTPVPGVKEWDDLGIARAECPLDVGRVQCMARLREQACKMGGDLLYDVPKRGDRPGEQAMVFMGHVAHTRAAAPDAGAGGEEAADTASTFDDSSPVEPLAPAPAAVATTDAGHD